MKAMVSLLVSRHRKLLICLKSLISGSSSAVHQGLPRLAKIGCEGCELGELLPRLANTHKGCTVSVWSHRRPAPTSGPEWLVSNA
jgi:hypothetical protein